MTYTDIAFIPVVTDRLEDYVKMAKAMGELWIEHGALACKECILEEDAVGRTQSIVKMANAMPTETVIISQITYQSKEHRNEVKPKVMSDPRVKEICGGSMPFDFKKMASHS